MRRNVKGWRMRARAVMVMGCAATIALGGVGEVAHADASSPTPVARLDCSGPIGVAAKLPSDFEGIRGTIGLETSRSSDRALGASRRADPATSPFRYFSKTGLFVRTGDDVARIIVPRAEQGRVALSWGSTDHDGIATREFDVGPCAGDARWIVFPGGFFVTEPHCVRLIVKSGGHERQVRVGVGAVCPGQLPPREVDRGVQP